MPELCPGCGAEWLVTESPGERVSVCEHKPDCPVAAGVAKVEEPANGAG